MSAITYQVGQFTVTLNLLRTLEGDQRPVRNGPDLIYQRWYLEFEGHINRRLNPVVAPFLPPAPNTGNPLVPAQFGGGLSDSPADKGWAVGQIMKQPGGIFTWYADDGSVYLQCPNLGLGHATDARHGPNPISFNYKEICGSEDILCHWVVELDVSLCGYPPLVLSHRWRMTSGNDGRTHLETRIIQGNAVFHVAELIRLRVIPDNLRGQLIHPLPPNYWRRDADVTATPDGDGLQYTIIDEEQSHNFNQTCSWIEVWQDSQVVQPGGTWVDQVNLALKLARIGEHAIERATRDALKTAGASFATSGASALADIAAETFSWSVAKLPQFWTAVAVQVWGNRFSTREQLQRIALDICTARLRTMLPRAALLGSPGHDVKIRQNLRGKYVSVVMALRHGPGLTASGYLPALTVPELMLKGYPKDEEIKGTGGEILISDKDRNNPTFPFSNGTRSTAGTLGRPGDEGLPSGKGWAGAILAQWYKSACQAPPQAVNYGYQYSTPAPGKQPDPAADPNLPAGVDPNALTTRPPVSGTQNPGGQMSTPGDQNKLSTENP
jgi:hypothetical protein